MLATRWQSLWLLTLIAILANCEDVEWDASNFPNPTAGDFERCNMKTTASLCDPDEVLTAEQRNRMNHELHELESRTRQDHAPDFCQKKGITAAMGIVKHVKGGTEQAAKDMANQMLRNWTLDDQCQKSVVIVLVTEDRRFWVARDPKVPVYAAEFNQIFKEQKAVFKSGDYAKGVANILQQTWEKALSKQGARNTGGMGASPGGGAKETTTKTVHIPWYVWLAIVGVIIPSICCCCFCYCCCCRSGGRFSNRRQTAGDMEMGHEGGTCHGGGGGMHHVGGMGMGGGGMGGCNDGGHFSAGPQPSSNNDTSGGGGGGGDGGGGLYPSKAVSDEGGGGSW